MKKDRPINLDLTTIRFPLPAITSILHRISGFALFIGLIFIMYIFEQSLDSQQGFDSTVELLKNNIWAKLVIWGYISALTYHLIAGIKHLLGDFGIGEELGSATLAASITLALSIPLILLAGVWLW